MNKERKPTLEDVPQVLPSWFDAYVHANRNYPQTTHGIYTFVGREITRSLLTGEVDLGYVAKSRFNTDQYAGLIDASIKAHEAMGIPVGPEGHTTETQKSFEPDFWFNGTWDEVKRSVVRALTYVSAGKNPWQPEIDSLALRRKTGDPYAGDSLLRDYINTSAAHKLAFDMRRSDAHLDNKYSFPLVEIFQESPEYNGILETVARMYEAAAGEHKSQENREASRIRRELFSQLSKEGQRDDMNWIGAYERVIFKNLKRRIIDFTREEGLTSEQGLCFLDATISVPRFILDEIDNSFDLSNLNEWRKSEGF